MPPTPATLPDPPEGASRLAGCRLGAPAPDLPLKLPSMLIEGRCMLRSLRRTLRALYENSPRENLRRARARAAGRSSGSKVLPDWVKEPSLLALIAAKIAALDTAVVLLGGEEAQALGRGLLDPERRITHVPWSFGESLDWSSIAHDASLVVCLSPNTASDWLAMRSLKQRHAGPVLGIHELVLPLTALLLAQDQLEYYAGTLEQIAPYYQGERSMSGIEELDRLFPLAGRRIIEMGPLDGCQTAAMVHAGAHEVTCIEARAENALKTLVAAHAMGWQNVRVVMDDFHNADAHRYGRFDLVFAHGVYYHSNAPFLFLENLLSLSDRVFLGGFCATDALPTAPWEELEYAGRRYRAKRYRETDNITAGVDEYGFFFHPEDLADFFRHRGYRVDILSSEACEVTAGNYTRLLASAEPR